MQICKVTVERQQQVVPGQVKQQACQLDETVLECVGCCVTVASFSPLSFPILMLSRSFVLWFSYSHSWHYRARFGDQIVEIPTVQEVVEEQEIPEVREPR